MTGTIIARVLAVIGAAVLTLATMVALVQGTILAVVADGLLGTVLLVWCIYLATHLAVRILGVGQDDFPPLPEDTSQIDLPKN